VISCRDALNLIFEYLDGELEDVSEEEVRAHFEACRRCFPHLKLEESFRAAVQRATRGKAAPPELRSRVIELLSEVDRG
jgi:anti-sigma factor (TIGR02949 family)